MSIRNYFKKLGKRAAGTWGRVNHKRDMRAASKGVRKSLVDMQVSEDVLTISAQEIREQELIDSMDIPGLDEEPH